jgi:membrane protease YdiL (CAAX protease family)
MLTGGLVSVFDLAGSPVVRVLQGNYIQVGFAGFAVAYLLWQGDWNRYIKVRWPTLEDFGWIVALPLLFAAQGVVLPPVLAAVGLPHPQPGTGMEELALETRPLLWPVAFVGMYLFAAPAEELVYRGIVQGRLRAAFDTLGVVVLAGLLFGVLHFLVGLMTQGVSFGGSLYWGIDTVIPGLAWGYAYERTENLVVTAVTHAMVWTVTLHEIVLHALPI